MKTTSFQSLAGLLCLGTGTLVFAQQQQLAPPPCFKDSGCVKSQTLQARLFPELKSQRVLVTYGPFSVPGAAGGHDMGNYAFPIASPCTDCLITQVQANLEYPNGTTANANTGMYLHHVVVYNNNTRSSSCPDHPEIVFGAGNERTLISPSLNGTVKAGQPFYKTDKLIFVGELMNFLSTARDAVISIDWEFIPSIPDDFRLVTPVWLDIDGACQPRGSEVPVPANQTTFTFDMNPPWTAQFSGDILQIFNHLHDGGEELQAIRNGAVVCSGKARYGEKPGYVEPGDHSDHEGGSGGGGPGHGGHTKRHEDKPHISSISSCMSAGRVEVGDKWSVKAEYNIARYKPMTMGSHVEPVMGISMVYVARDKK